MKRSTKRPHRRAKTPRQLLRARLDRLAREATFRRDKVCQRCGGEKPLQWCHVHTRAIISLRHDLDNCLVLCAGDHLWWHQHPLEAIIWFCDKFPERAKRLAIRRQVKTKPDLKAIEVYLKELLKEET